MAGEIATAFVSILPSFKGGASALTTQLNSAAGTAGATAGKTAGGKFSGTFGTAIKGVAGGLAAAFAVSGAINFFGSAIDGASDLNETVSKSKVIFGDQFAALDQWASQSATTLGLPKQAALEAAAGFGDMFTQIGFAGDEAAALAQSTVGLSADLGSFNNLPTADVAARISAAFRGEYDSLQTLIPNINAARVQSEAFAATGKTVASELTAQEKAAAVLAIVHKDGAKAAGDFARTSDGLANKQKILSARFTDVKTKIGSALVPVMNALVGVVISVIGFFEKNADTLKTVFKVVGIVAGVITALFIPTLISMGVQATINAAKVVAGWVATAAGAVAASVAQGLAVVKMVAGWALMGAKALLGAAKVALAWLIAMGPIALVIAAVIGLVALIVANFDTIKEWIGAAWDWVKEKTVAVWDAIVSWVSGIPGKILGVLSGLWDFISTQAGAMKDAVIEVGVGIVTWFTGLPAALVGALSGLGMQLYGVGQDIIEKLWAGLRLVWDRLAGWFTDALDWLTGLWPFSPAKHGPLRQKPPSAWGENIMSGLVKGLESQRGKVQRAADGIAGIMAGVGGSATFSASVERPMVRTPRGVASRALSAGDTGGGASASGVNLNVKKYYAGRISAFEEAQEDSRDIAWARALA